MNMMIHKKYARVMHLGVDLCMKPVTDDQYASLVSYEGRELITESLTMEELESTFFNGVPVAADSAMLEAITTTRSKLDTTMRAFIRALNGQLKGSEIKAGDDTAGAVSAEKADTGTVAAESGNSEQADGTTPAAETQSIGGAIIGRVRNINSIPVLPAQIPLSDGQSVSVVFLSPTATNKIASGDQLVAFQFLLNKRDVTHIAAPMGGEDLSLKQVALSLSNLIEKNSRKFKNAQARKSAQAEDLTNLETESDNLETQLAEISDQGDTLKAQNDGIQQQIDTVAKQADGVEQHIKELQAQLTDLQTKQAAKAPELNPTTPEGYAKVSEDEGLQLKYQDQLDSFFSGRVTDVRNALRDLGWDGPKYKSLEKGGNTLSVAFKYVGAGKNVVAASYEVKGDKYFFMSDNLTMSAADLAAKIDSAVSPAPQPEPAPTPPAEQNNSVSVMASGVKASGVDKVGDKFTVDKIGMGSVNISYPRTKDEMTLTTDDATSSGVIVKGFNDKDYVSIASGLFDSVEKTFNGRGMIDFATQDKLFDVISKDLPELIGDMRIWVIQQVMSAEQAKIIAAQKEAENKIVQNLNWYGLRARPFAYANQPGNSAAFIEADKVATDPRTKDLVANIDESNYRHGAVGYESPLSDKDISGYELVDLSKKQGDAGSRAEKLAYLRSIVGNMIGMGDDEKTVFNDLIKPNGQYVSVNPFYDESERNYRSDQITLALKEAGYTGAVDKAFAAFYTDVLNDADRQKKEEDAANNANSGELPPMPPESGTDPQPQPDPEVDYEKEQQLIRQAKDNNQLAIEAVKKLIKGVKMPAGMKKTFDERKRDGWLDVVTDKIPAKANYDRPVIFIEYPAVGSDEPDEFMAIPDIDELGAPTGTFTLSYSEGSPLDGGKGITKWTQITAAIKDKHDKDISAWALKMSTKTPPPAPTPDPEPTPTPESNSPDNVVTKALAELKALMDNETNVDAYLMKMESLFNEIDAAGAVKENEPFMQKVADRLTQLMDAEEVA